MKTYIETRIIRAKPMEDIRFLQEVEGRNVHKSIQGDPGYYVLSPDGPERWISKETFEHICREMTDTERKLL